MIQQYLRFGSRPDSRALEIVHLSVKGIFVEYQLLKALLRDFLLFNRVLETFLDLLLTPREALHLNILEKSRNALIDGHLSNAGTHQTSPQNGHSPVNHKHIQFYGHIPVNYKHIQFYGHSPVSYKRILFYGHSPVNHKHIYFKDIVLWITSTSYFMAIVLSIINISNFIALVCQTQRRPFLRLSI